MSLPNRPHPRGTYLLSVTVENVRAFGPGAQTLDLSNGQGNPSPWTVVLGENGSGKSTLLEAIAALSLSKDSSAPGLPRGIRRPDFIDAYPTIGSGPDWAFQVQTWEGVLGDAQGTSGSVRMPFVNSTLPPTVKSELAGQLPRVYGYGSNRRPARSYSQTESLDDPVATLFDDSVPLRNTDDWLLKLDYAARVLSNVQQVQSRRRDQVIELLKNVLPGVSDVKVFEPTSVSGQPTLKFSTQGLWVPFKYLGYGYQTMTAWLVDLASRMFEDYEQSEDPLSEPAVVLIDEVDLHLHPSWQRSLIEYVSKRFRNTQFIVTAHSPLFVQSAETANLAVLKRHLGKTVIENDVESIRNWRIDQILTSDLFSLPGSWPHRAQQAMSKRRELLSKVNFSEADAAEVSRLEAEIGPIPAGETAESARTTLLLQETLAALEGLRRKQDDSHS